MYKIEEVLEGDEDGHENEHGHVRGWRRQATEGAGWSMYEQ